MKENCFFLDTAYVIALLNPNDAFHKKAKSIFMKLVNAREIWTTEAILTEIGNALATTSRSKAVEFINSCYDTMNVFVVTVDGELFRKGL